VVLDASAVIAVLFEEPGFRSLVDRAGNAQIVLIGAPTVFEASMVLARRVTSDVHPRLMGLLNSMRVEIVPFGVEHFEVATDAFLRYGKGRHPARLNFGDCMSYAVASLAGLPLLYTGTDFSKTDIQAA
jgi:ribonuclease VapC